MGTEVHYKSSFPGYYSMRDVNDDANSSSWPLFYGEKTLTNGHYYNGYVQRTITDDKDALKQKMLEHEAIFKDQVYELHRLYRRQRDMMEEVKRKEFHKHQISIDTSSSSSRLPSQKPYEDAHRWHMPGFPIANSTCARPSLFGGEISNSPLSCSKGNSSKDCEVVECRPSKVRKKLFDLQLPADEYIDPEDGEQMQDNHASEISSYPPKENHGLPKNELKAFPDIDGKTDSYKDTSSGQHFRRSNGLADLNEPVHVEETNGASSVDFLGRSTEPAASQFLSRPQELFEKSQNGIHNGTFNNLQVEGKGNGRDWLSSMREAGNSRSHMNFPSQCFQPEKLHMPYSHAMQQMRGKEHQHRGIYSEISDRIQEHSHFNQNPLPFAASHMSGSYPFVNSPDIGNSWSPPIPSWGKPNSSLTHKLTSFQTHPSFLSSSQSHEVFGDKWHMNGFYRPNTGTGSDVPTCNGFYHGSSSGLKEPCARFTSVGLDYRNCSKLDDGSQKQFKGSNFIDLTGTTKGVDLNTVQTLSNEDNDTRKQDQAVLPWLKAKPAVGKNDASCDHSFRNGVPHVSSVSNDHLDGGCKERGDSLTDNKKILGFPIFGNSCISKNDSSSLVSTSASLQCIPENGKIKKEMEHTGIDINVAWDEAILSEPIDKQIDVETLEVGKEKDTEVKNFKNHFDLNSCVTEDEDLLVTDSVRSPSEKVKKMALDIDLEAPAVPDIEEEAIQCGDEHKKLDAPLQLPEQKLGDPENEELVRVAAESIVVMSGQQDHVGSTTEVAVPSTDVDDPLLLFAEAVTTCMEHVGSASNELDEYEMLTLQLEETKEEDYMPKPLAPDFREPDEAGAASLLNRPRRGQTRRGRPRRDFQRDILPGLVSLSRHEVTEDLQVFGGLMRATGHSWNLGLTRRNGTRSGTRGRRKAVVVVEPPVAPAPLPLPPLPPPPPPPPLPPPPPPPLQQPLKEQLNSTEVVGLEERSLTGWGKTTRRPRRQRCAAGNSVAVPST